MEKLTKKQRTIFDAELHEWNKKPKDKAGNPGGVSQKQALAVAFSMSGVNKKTKGEKKIVKKAKV